MARDVVRLYLFAFCAPQILLSEIALEPMQNLYQAELDCYLVVFTTTFGTVPPRGLIQRIRQKVRISTEIEVANVVAIFASDH